MYGQLCEPLHTLLADSTILPDVLAINTLVK